MNGPSASEEPIAAEAPRDTLELHLLETAARYLYVNSLPLPLVVIGLAGILWHWYPIAALAAWGTATLVTWAALGLLLQRFLHDEGRLQHRRQWSIVLGAALSVATCTLASVAPLFWVQDDRLNNVLLYVFVAAGMANAAGQSAPSRILAAANLTPYAATFLSLFMIHETYPFNLALAALGSVYCGLVVMYAKAVRQLASEMLLLREEKRALVGRLETALADATTARKRAETASRAKSQFLANMSHELRTPLNAVLGFAEVIRDRLYGDDAMARYSEYAGNIHASGNHLLGLINDILDLSKIEAGKLELAPERFDLAEDVGEALRFVEPQATRKHVTLVRDMPTNFEVFADKRALRQIAVNLLGNAVKFTPPGGRVTLSLGRDALGHVRIAVSDTGIGIRREDLDRVLETFGQGRHDISPAEEHGTGLGLAIAKSLAEAHGGQIGIESQVGEGTTVTVTLPQLAEFRTEAA
jgi:two-component system cell cycle sensor histidine kinase PleC